jgi:hypothetical protein
MDPTGSRWIPLDPAGSRWIPPDPNGSHGSRWIPLDPAGSQWILVDPGIRFFPLGQIFLHLFSINLNQSLQMFIIIQLVDSRN